MLEKEYDDMKRIIVTHEGRADWVAECLDELELKERRLPDWTCPEHGHFRCRQCPRSWRNLNDMLLNSYRYGPFRDLLRYLGHLDGVEIENIVAWRLDKQIVWEVVEREPPGGPN